MMKKKGKGRTANYVISQNEECIIQIFTDPNLLISESPKMSQ